MKVLILAVTYRTYDILPSFLEAVDKAALACKNADVTVAIGDNTDVNFKDIELNATKVKVKIHAYHENLGYLNCALRMLREETVGCSYDYVAVTNVDLRLDVSFFNQLLGINSIGMGWLAPDVYTPDRGTHENPFMMSRPTNRQFRKWLTMYSLPLLFGIAKKISYYRHSTKPFKNESVDMYAGHGSIMLFTWDFIKENLSMVFPSFMYAEEIYLAELVHRMNMRVVYMPQLKVVNTGSQSVKMLGNKWECACSKQSTIAIKKMFFA